MKKHPEFLHVEGTEILNGQGDVVILRGFNLGGWMNMENFMTGYPGHESGMRNAITDVLGEKKARFFFDRFLHYFIMKEDLQYIKDLGCNVVRIPFNYRHFESDDQPFEYKEEGFVLLDKLIHWASELELYVILDLHAVQGWQSRGWHCDNPSRTAMFWGQKGFEDRAVALWEALAQRYRQEVFVAGYNVMNEPEADEASWLNHYYRGVTGAIRQIDPDHILFLEGNQTSQKFDELDPPFDDNTVYSSHLYVEPGVELVEYPGPVNGEDFNRDHIEQIYNQRTAFMRKHGVPHFFGEFGCIYSDPDLEESRLRVMADMIAIAESYSDHWTIWSYKDIGKMGLVVLDPDSEWMQRTKPVREIKSALRCDSWIERHRSRIDKPILNIANITRSVVEDRAKVLVGLEEKLHFSICDGLLSQVLQPIFAEQFLGMSESEIEDMMQSFAFMNCIRRTELGELIQEII
jgi:endoglucanase